MDTLSLVYAPTLSIRPTAEDQCRLCQMKEMAFRDESDTKGPDSEEQNGWERRVGKLMEVEYEVVVGSEKRSVKFGSRLA